MKLISLKINQFKNLNNFELDFSGKNGMTVLIGNNGCGKSNIIEAISGIFKSLYLITDTSKRVDFDFELDYSINVAETNHEMKVIFADNTFTITSNQDGNITQANTQRYLPSQLVALYSGEELRLWKEYYESFYLNYNTAIIGNTKNIESSQQMLYINKYYWDIALLVMLANDLDLSEIIGDITLETIDITFNLENVNKFAKINTNETLSFVGKLSNKQDSISVNLDDFKELADYESAIRMYKFLSVSYLPKAESNKLITNIDLTFSNGTKTNSFSEGEKKKILLKLVMEVLADDKSLVLLDEPDSHIHIAHKKQIKEMIENSERESILTTHSPTLMNVFDEHLVFLENGEIKGKEKSEILDDISGSSMSDAQKIILLNSNTDILIVEGKTDETYIETALEKLKPTNPEYSALEFNFLYMGGSDPEVLKNLSDKFPAKEGQTIIALFDRDTAGSKIIKSDKLLNFQGTNDQFTGGKVKDIEIRLIPKKDGFTYSNFEIEDYFPIEKCRDFMFNGFNSFKDLKPKFKKAEFAEECKNFDATDFEGFKKLFDMILEIKAD
ncbi:ATP-dependent nuclease [Kordia sp.]|uniref:ATP-dependent nuclease n=1 Tax=Kordia sp. TaxID=1965332 RepID=UPI003D2AD481